MPSVAQGPIQSVLGMVTSILNTVLGQFTPGSGGTSGGTPSGGLAGGITGIVGGVLNQIQSLLGSLFGNLFGGFGFGAPTVVN
jgi:hypothetical protein